MPADAAATSASVAARGREQTSADGGRLFVARVPSLGYATEGLARAAANGEASITLQSDGTVAVLANDAVRATLRRDAGWGITSLVDRRSGRELIRDGQTGNALVPYADQGGLYRFGNEMKGCSLEPLAGEDGGSALTVLEQGPLRVRVAA